MFKIILNAFILLYNKLFLYYKYKTIYYKKSLKLGRLLGTFLNLCFSMKSKIGVMRWIGKSFSIERRNRSNQDEIRLYQMFSMIKRKSS